MQRMLLNLQDVLCASWSLYGKLQLKDEKGISSATLSSERD